MSIHQVRDLLKRYQRGECTPWEKKLVEQWFQHLTETGEVNWSDEEREKIHKLIKSNIWKQTEEREKSSEARIISRNRMRWWAAASVVLLMGVSVCYQFFKNEDRHPTDVVTEIPKDVPAPQSNRATITLADGTKVFLDSAEAGALAVQGSVKLVKLPDGKIVYQNASGEIMQELSYNTLSNPRGSEVIHIVLADGSTVWLNAGSSLTFPVAFVGPERKVSISGEAYFEVTHDRNKPFIVSKGEMNIRVLGTHFNVNAFGDDGQKIEVTLLEGSVEVRNGHAEELLKPGQQATVGKDLEVIQHANIEAVMAWKNGYFHFEDASLQNVMQRIGRWYDANVVYQGIVPVRKFTGEMQRDLSLSEVLKILEKNGVRFRIEGKELLVLPE